MSVLIKGMQLPDMCGHCRFATAFECEVTKNFITTFNVRQSDCPLIEVPEPHGRLIDADALVEDLKRQCEEVFKIDAVSPDDFWITRDQAYNERLWKTWCESFFEYLKTSETIIPESKEEVDEAQRDYQAAADYQQYCETYEQTYDPETGAM